MEKNRASPPQRRISSNPFCKIVLAGRLCTMQTRASPFALCSTFAIFDCIEDRMRLGHAKPSKLLLHGSRLSLSLIASKTGCGSAMATKQVCCHCSHLSLSLAVAEERMRLGHAKPSKLLLHGSRLSLSLRPVAGPDTRPPGIETACQRPPKPRPCPRT